MGGVAGFANHPVILAGHMCAALRQRSRDIRHGLHGMVSRCRTALLVGMTGEAHGRILVRHPQKYGLFDTWAAIDAMGGMTGGALHFAGVIQGKDRRDDHAGRRLLHRSDAGCRGVYAAVNPARCRHGKRSTCPAWPLLFSIHMAPDPCPGPQQKRYRSIGSGIWRMPWPNWGSGPVPWRSAPGTAVIRQMSEQGQSGDYRACRFRFVSALRTPGWLFNIRRSTLAACTGRCRRNDAWRFICLLLRCGRR